VWGGIGASARLRCGFLKGWQKLVLDGCDDEKEDEKKKIGE
jgi:hypothetical protein